MVDDVGLAEGQAEYKCRLNSCIHTAHEVGAAHKEHAELPGHNDRVKQGVADGYEPVICHHGQEVAFSRHCNAEQEELRCTCCVRYDFCLCHKGHQSAGYNDGGVADI